ncbi:MAG: hypothetical protein LBP65_00525 [Puniceicoccales bacterium]|nr:hypothetical protein [Puniceicoccales bacterium]
MPDTSANFVKSSSTIVWSGWRAAEPVRQNGANFMNFLAKFSKTAWSNTMMDADAAKSLWETPIRDEDGVWFISQEGSWSEFSFPQKFGWCVTTTIKLIGFGVMVGIGLAYAVPALLLLLIARIANSCGCAKLGPILTCIGLVPYVPIDWLASSLFPKSCVAKGITKGLKRAAKLAKNELPEKQLHEKQPPESFGYGSKSTNY